MNIKQTSKSWIIGMIIMAFMSIHGVVSAQTNTIKSPAKKSDTDTEIAGRICVGLKNHIPYKKDGEWWVLGHFVLDNTKSDLVDNNKTEWVAAVVPNKKMVRQFRRLNKAFLIDYVLVSRGKNSYYLISNWQPTGDDVQDKIAK